MELRGRRDGPRSMKTNQRIYKKGGGHVTVPSEAKLHFTYVGTYFGGSYWKVHQLATSSCDESAPTASRRRRPHQPQAQLLPARPDRTRAGRRSPPSRVYPGCNQDPFRDRVKLGTSVGWSDIYPAAYHQQWIDVAGLRGCFVYRMIVDPRNTSSSRTRDDNAPSASSACPTAATRGC